MLPGGVGTAAPVETERAVAPSNVGGTASNGGAGLPVDDGGGGGPADDDGRLSGPGVPVGGGGGTLLPLAVRLGGAGPFGGGGAPRVTVLLLGSFLLTHFFKSLS